MVAHPLEVLFVEGPVWIHETIGGYHLAGWVAATGQPLQHLLLRRSGSLTFRELPQNASMLSLDFRLDGLHECGKYLRTQLEDEVVGK